MENRTSAIKWDTLERINCAVMEGIDDSACSRQNIALRVVKNQADVVELDGALQSAGKIANQVRQVAIYCDGLGNL